MRHPPAYVFGGRKFTGREREVWKGYALSGTTKSIGSDIGISPKTVEYHLANLYKKLRVNDYSALTRLAIKHQLIRI